MNTLGIMKEVSLIKKCATIWKPPPFGFLKTNIDGAAKGNLKLVSFEDAIRDDQEQI